jgi:hypothetical protein
MDAAQRPPQAFVRGFAFADTTPSRDIRDEAAAAYEERTARLENAWRKERSNDVAHDATPSTLDAARSLADQAYLERTARISNAWRNR